MSRTYIPPVTLADMTDQQRDIVKPVTGRDGKVANVFGTLVQNPEMLRAWSNLGLYLMRGSRVDPICREILILRTAVNTGTEYEWHHHRHIGKHLGMSDTLINAVRAGHTLEDEQHNLMMQCADELSTHCKLSAETWNRMIEDYGFAETTDAILTVGGYTALGMLLQSAGVQIDD